LKELILDRVEVLDNTSADILLYDFIESTDQIVPSASKYQVLIDDISEEDYDAVARSFDNKPYCLKSNSHQTDKKVVLI
jgi:hypothetical protein